MVLATGLFALEGMMKQAWKVWWVKSLSCVLLGMVLERVCPLTAVAMAAEGHPCNVSTTFSLKSCPSALLELGKPILRQSQSPITENYHFTLHTDMDLCNSMISWFLEGKCSLPHMSILNTSSFLKKKEFVELHPNATIATWSEPEQEKQNPEGDLHFPCSTPCRCPHLCFETSSKLSSFFFKDCSKSIRTIFYNFLAIVARKHATQNIFVKSELFFLAQQVLAQYIYWC